MNPLTDFVEDENRQSDILQRISEGDIAAVSECLDKYGKLIWSLAKKFTYTREDAEDAVQDIFIDVWKYAARFDADKSPEGAFVTLIARRRLIDRLRKIKTQPQIVFFESEMENQASDADKKLQMRVELKSVIGAFDKLNPHEQRIMQMAVYGGMTHSEIAESFNLPLGTVKSQLRRGYRKLRASLGQSLTLAA